MALAGVKGRSDRAAGLRWDWRAERQVIARALGSGYPYLLALAAGLALLLAYQSARPVGVALGGGYDAPYIRGFYERETGERSRYATDAARVVLPGVGGRASTLAITAAARPDGLGQPVRVRVNGIAIGDFTPGREPRQYRFDLPAAYYSYGDLTVDFLSTPQEVRGQGAQVLRYGPRLSEIRVEPAPGNGGLVKPPLAVLLAWLVIAPALYFVLLRLGVRAVLAGGLSLVTTVAGTALLEAWRLDMALFSPRLAFLLVLTYLVLVGSDLLVPRLFARGGVTVAATAWRLLQLILLFSLTLKLGGIVFPQLIVIDQPWHAQQFEKVLQGRFLAIYRPDPAGISSVPGHWGIQAQIPYPPFLYVFGLPFYLWPLGKALSINLWSGLLDVSRVFLVFYLARRLGATTRAGLVAAFVIGLTASTFLLHSWGNYPTTISQWCLLLFLTLLVANWRNLRRPAVFVGLLVLLTIAMLLYTVTAAFAGVLLLALLGSLAWRGGLDGRRNLAPVAGLLVGAAAIAFFAYYVQYVGPLLTETLPAFNSALNQGAAVGLTERPPLPVYLWNYGARLWRYGVLISALLAPYGAWLLLRRQRDRLAGPVLGAWFVTWAVFFAIGLRIDMVDKEVWFILPALAICAGVACDAVLTRLRQGRGVAGAWAGRVAVALYLAHLTWGGLTVWLYRIVSVRH